MCDKMDSLLVSFTKWLIPRDSSKIVIGKHRESLTEDCPKIGDGEKQTSKYAYLNTCSGMTGQWYRHHDDGLVNYVAGGGFSLFACVFYDKCLEPSHGMSG